MSHITKAFFVAAALVGSGLLLSSCSSTNLADVVQQLSKDTATSCFDITISTPWGTQKATYARSNAPNNSAASDTNGCAFQHGGAPVAPAAGIGAGSLLIAPAVPAVPASPAVKAAPLPTSSADVLNSLTSAKQIQATRAAMMSTIQANAPQ